MLETTDGRAWIKHYMFDFGSILGSGTVYAQRHRPGNEYMFEQKPGWLTLATLGLYVRPWMTIDYPRVPRSVGRLEAERFDPLALEAGISQPGLRQHAARTMRSGLRASCRSSRTRRFARSSRKPHTAIRLRPIT